MVAILLSALFIASGLLAAGVIASNMHRYAGAFSDLRRELVKAPAPSHANVRITEVRVTRTATVLRPSFTDRTSRPAQPALPAAA